MSADRLILADLSPGRAGDERSLGLDWLRAGAALAVVALHAGIPAMTHPLPALGWCVLPGEGSGLVDALCWAINGCVMPLFFLMGGYLAAGSWRRSPDAAFVQHRSRRLLIPLAVAFFLVLPADMYVWLAGWVAEGLIRARKVQSIKLPEPLSSQFWGVAHLWYLECLWVISMAAAAMGVMASWRRPLSEAAITKPLRQTWARLKPVMRSLSPHTPGVGLLLALVSGAILAGEPEILIGFRQRWFPSPLMILFYSTFFLAGWMWPRTSGTRDDVRNALAGLVRTVILFPVLLQLIHRHVESPQSGLSLFGLTVVFSLYGWWAATSLFSLALAVRPKRLPESAAYVAEASFWMYLVHHPFACLTQVALLRSSLGPETRFIISFGMAVWLSLATYAAFVRNTRLGDILNGRRTVSRSLEPFATPIEQSPVRRAA
jgi:fucose 4-O-acetylase-like acetyltransferase